MGLTAGDVIGRYTIDRRLGAGGMAEAYLAHNEGMGGFKKTVVVKVLQMRHARNGANIELFLREARVGGRLSHANIVQIFDVGEHEGLHYIAMEYVDGLTLLQATKRCWALGQGIPIDVAVRIIAAAAEGLHHAHTLRNADGSDGHIIHRDISPDNIMISRDGTVKVLDFGVARIGGAEATKSGDIKGKIPFMPPEQLSGSVEIDARADLYALGVTLYWCLTARRPFAASNPALLMASIMDDTPLPAGNFNSDMSPELEAVVMNLLEKDREDRIASAQKLAARLNKLVPASQENIIARFIDRMRQFDDDPPEARPEAKMTGGWPAIVLPQEQSAPMSELNPPNALPMAESGAVKLIHDETKTQVSDDVASTGLDKLTASMLANITSSSGGGSSVFTDSEPQTVVDARIARPSSSSATDPVEPNARPAPAWGGDTLDHNADVTVDENARLPGADRVDDRSIATAVVTRAPAHLPAPQTQLWRIAVYAIAAAALVGLVVGLVLAVVGN